MTAYPTANRRMLTKLMMRLLPIQILLALVGSVNGIVTSFFASNYVGTEAMAAVDNLLDIIWTIPTATLVISRILIGVSIGEEDRQSLADVMRVMMRRYVPIMTAAAAVYIIFAVPLTEVYYHDPSQPVYWMTVWGFRILLSHPFNCS